MVFPAKYGGLIDFIIIFDIFVSNVIPTVAAFLVPIGSG